MNVPPPRRLLCVHPGALGDLLQALPGFGRARAAFPDASLTLLTGDPFESVARATGLFDDVRTFPAAPAYRGGPMARTRALLRLAAAARSSAPDRVGVFKAAPVFAFAARVSGAPVRAGLTRGFGAHQLTVPLAVDAGRHREDRYLDVVAALGADAVPPAPPRWPCTPPPAALGALQSGAGHAGPFVGLAPGGARNVKGEMPERRWPAARYGELAGAVFRQLPTTHFVLLGSAGDAGEAAAAHEAARRAGVPAACLLDLTGHTSVLEARAAIAALDVVIAHDSGLLHVAATTATPIIAVFGPTDPRVAAPRGPRVRVLWEPSGPTPCHDDASGRLLPCGPDGACCTPRVSTESAAAAALQALGVGTRPEAAVGSGGWAGRHR